MEKVDEEIVKEALIARGDLEEGDDFAFTDVVDVVVEENSGITTINKAFTKQFSGTSFDDKFNEELRTATLNGITTIGKNAFIYCIALTTVTLSENAAVGYAAFYNCFSLSYGLNNIDFSKITSIGEYAFAGCESLTTVDLSNLSGDGSNSLGENAFYQTAFFYSGADVGKVTIYYGTQSDNDKELLDNLTIPDADGFPFFNNKLENIGLASEREECDYYPFGQEPPTVHYKPAASYTPSTTAYSIPNPAARFILNL